jgi:hypothetical protein
MSNLPQKNSVANTIKLYLFPSLVTIISMLIWRDISELRADVKALLAQSNIDKTRIDNLMNDVKSLEGAVFQRKTAMNTRWFEAVNHDPWYKPEEEYDVKKYLPSSKA